MSNPYLKYTIDQLSELIDRVEGEIESLTHEDFEEMGGSLEETELELSLMVNAQITLSEKEHGNR